jgi:hypothetical protein
MNCWIQFARLTRWKGTVTQRPKYWGKFVMELVLSIWTRMWRSGWRKMRLHHVMARIIIYGCLVGTAAAQRH